MNERNKNVYTAVYCRTIYTVELLSTEHVQRTQSMNTSTQPVRVQQTQEMTPSLSARDIVKLIPVVAIYVAIVLCKYI